MSWLDANEPMRLKFECEDGHLEVFESLPADVCYDDQECNCGKVSKYAGHFPRKTNLMGKVLYEKNGRKAYAISSGNGTITHMSKTKYDYLESAGTVTPAYSSGYTEHLLKTGQGDQLLPQDLTKIDRTTKATVTKMLKDRKAEKAQAAPERNREGATK
jgi:hypothetical protein